MHLIADSGSTKTEWNLIDRTRIVAQYRTSGINPVYLCREEIISLLEKELLCEKYEIQKVYFYGAGCAFEDKNLTMKEAISHVLGVDDIEISSDLLAAARSLCRDSSGICCILGTGSNSCYYDGKEIVQNVPPLGFILGDEGSGAVLGKKLLGNVLKGIFPEEIRELFFKEIGLSYPELIQKVYREPLPNRFLASLTQFVYNHRNFPEMEEIIKTSLDEFLERNVLQYPHARALPVHFTGSTAYYFRDILIDRLAQYDLKPGNIVRTPMEGLVTYHQLFFGDTF